MKKNPLFPEVLQKTESEIIAIIEQINRTDLSEGLKQFIIKCIEIAIWVPMALESKSISLHRLKTIIFGKGYGRKNQKNKSKSSKDQAEQTPSSVLQGLALSPSEGLRADTAPNPPTKTKLGHGRMSHTVYQHCKEITLKLVDLVAGSLCPLNCGGKLSIYKPGVFVRIKGQNFSEVIRYTVEKLRCSLCNQVFLPKIPPEVGTEKYDASFKAILAILKYYVAVPFYRQAHFQKMLGFPISDSTQWDLIEQLAGFCYPIFAVLKRLAANGTLLFNDDTKLLILEVIKMIKAGAIGAKGRTGMYTTGIIAENNGHKIALFLNGQQHSGENVADVLQFRDPIKGPIMQMCDALSANIPKRFKTIVCHCLAHGFRKFSDLVDYFEEECLTIIQKLSLVFEHDELTHNMSNNERLTYHQKHSKPIMDECFTYMRQLLEEHRIEPNSELGKAIRYMQRHWLTLTRFLTMPGAPIDNNIVERALKIAIRNRKSAMFYRTTYSAAIGGMLTSLIYTCHLADQNPHHYLIALQNHKTAVLAAPEQWLPWNYQAAIVNGQTNDANPLVHSPPLDGLVAA